VYLGATENLFTEVIIHDIHMRHIVQYAVKKASKITSLIDIPKHIEFQSPQTTRWSFQYYRHAELLEHKLPHDMVAQHC
jgi:hypothetical protein